MGTSIPVLWLTIGPNCGGVATLWVIKTIFAIGQQTIARLWMSCQVVGELPRYGDFGPGCGGN